MPDVTELLIANGVRRAQAALRRGRPATRRRRCGRLMIEPVPATVGLFCLAGNTKQAARCTQNYWLLYS